MRFCQHFHGLVHDPQRKDALFDCGAGVNAFAIDPLGKLSACLMWHGQTYDLRKGSFRKGWEKFLKDMLQKKMTRQTKCSTCEIKAMCGMCPVTATLECRDPETPVDFLCRVAHLRAYALDLPISPHGDCEYCRGGREYDSTMETVAALRGKGEEVEGAPRPVE